MHVLAIANVGGAIWAALFRLISAFVHVLDLLLTSLSGPNSIIGIVQMQSRSTAIAAVCAAVSALAYAAIPYFP